MTSGQVPPPRQGTSNLYLNDKPIHRDAGEAFEFPEANATDEAKTDRLDNSISAKRTQERWPRCRMKLERMSR